MSGNKKVPMRKCVGCQEMKSKKEMIRVIRTAEGEFLLDSTGRKNGRGAYICPAKECLEKAWKRRWIYLNQNKILSLIGLATKAGRTVSGEFSTEKEVKSGRAALVIVADDASDNTKKKFKNMCDFYHVPIYFYKDKDTLGHAMGKQFRASLAILDEGFAKGIRKHMDTEENTIA